MAKTLQLAVILGLTLSSVLFIASCRKNPTTEASNSDTHPIEKKSSISTELTNYFPLLPVVETYLWRELLAAESTLAAPESAPEDHAVAVKKIEDIAKKLRQRYPFSNDANTTRLGGITYRKATKQLEIFAKVHLPKKDQHGEHSELELILCSLTGRTHETLFVTEARPLHLELLLHLTGFKKPPKPSEFQVSISLPNREPIPVEALIKTTTDEALPKKIIWEFSGSNFTDLYPPDQTGDFILCWHAHDSVLRIRHHGIASGTTKLKAIPHPLLNEDMVVKLILTPVHP